MKKLLVSVLAIAGLVACSQEQTLVSKSPASMEFGVASLDKATRVDPSLTTDNLQGFNVWAWMDDENGNVLTAEDVEKVGGEWRYFNTAYWMPGHNYSFAAVAPMDSTNWEYQLNGTDNGENNTIYFKNVDGTEDLIYAFATRSTTNKVDEDYDAVELRFNHLLSKTKFTFVNGFATDNVTVQVKDVKMTAKSAATYSIKDAAWGEVAGDVITLAYGDTEVIAAGGKCVVADERLTIPAAAATSYEITYTIQVWYGANPGFAGEGLTKTTTLTGWEFEQGKSYNFVAEITPESLNLDEIEFTVVVNEWDHTDVDSAEAFANALKAETASIHVTLTEDIDVAISSLGQQTGGSGEYKLGGEGTEAITIDLNGHKLNITTTYWSVLGAKNADAVFTIKNGTMTSSQATGTWNSYDLGFANCNYNFENVVFDKAIALEAANKTYNLKNVTINETHDYYAMWVSAKGQTVNIDGLTINSLGRGIKIDEQYVAAPAKVTMNVANATFKTAKKAAVIVKSVAGAVINWGAGNDIANVAEDDTFAVWVDEDSAAYADKVVVNGAMVKVEGSAAQLVTSNDELATAVNNGATKVYLADGTYTLAKYPAGLHLVGNGDNVVLDVQGKVYGVNGNVTIENVKLVYSNANYKGFQHTNVETYKNCTIVGQPFLYGNDVTFEGCTFEQTSANAYNVWTYGASAVKFVDCVFNSAGKSVLIYAEGGSNGQVALFEGCTLNASAPAEGKAAIEIDSSLIKGVYDITINDTTATGFANGNVSGNSLWNNKKGDKATITVDGVKVL